jgi:septal ring factor EnvC (AmiA/AmiB activator)
MAQISAAAATSIAPSPQAFAAIDAAISAVGQQIEGVGQEITTVAAELKAAEAQLDSTEKKGEDKADLRDKVKALRDDKKALRDDKKALRLQQTILMQRANPSGKYVAILRLLGASHSRSLSLQIPMCFKSCRSSLFRKSLWRSSFMLLSRACRRCINQKR